MIELLTLIIGLVFGSVIAYFIARGQASKILLEELTKQKYELTDFFEERLREEIARVEQEQELKYEQRIDIEIAEARKRSLNSQRSSLKGKMGEQVAPYHPLFLEGFEPADARFIGNPVDYLVFVGHSKGYNADTIEIYIVEIKTGKSAVLTSMERKIKVAVEEGRVYWKTIHVPDPLPT